MSDQPNARRVLANAPLIRVLCQVRWPELANFSLDETSKSLARRLGDIYPLLTKQTEMAVMLTPAGIKQQDAGYISRFATPDGKWVVSVGNTFVALETSAYPGHTVFINRLRAILDALRESASIPFWNRLGYRYTNRIVGEEELSHLSERFEPSVLGGATSTPPHHELVHSITESVYRVNSDLVLVRSARVGPGQSIDPSLPGVDSPSWILDLDAYHEGNAEAFSPSEIVARATELAEIAHKQFSAVVKDEFYVRYG